MLAEAPVSLQAAFRGLGKRRPVSLKKAIERIDRLRQPTLQSMLFELNCAQVYSAAAVILKELDPSAYNRFHEENIVEHALNAIQEVAPLMWNVFELDVGDLVSQGLAPDPMGFAMGWDEWDQISADPSECGEAAEMYVFFTALRLQEAEALARAAQEFEWDIEIPDLKNIQCLDGKKLKRKLKRRGLESIWTAMEVCWYETGNIYFDYNPYDELEIPDLPAFSLEGVRKLQEEYLKALDISAVYDTAREMWDGNPGLVRELLKMYTSCLVYEVKPERGRTLAEIFAAEEYGDDENGRLIIDPFYGPIGGNYDPDDIEFENE